MVKCKNCGAELLDTQKFCNHCGKPQFGDIPEISWTGKISLVKNPLVFRAYLMLFGIVSILGLLLSVFTGNFYLLVMFVIIAAVLIGLFLLTSMLMEWVTDGGLAIQGIVNKEGVAHQAGSGNRSLNKGYLIIGLLSLLGGDRSGLTAFGGGLLAASQESNSIPWKDVKSVKVYPRNRLIVLRDATYIKAVVLYCTKDNFDKILEVIKKNVSYEITFS